MRSAFGQNLFACPRSAYSHLRFSRCKASIRRHCRYGSQLFQGLEVQAGRELRDQRGPRRLITHQANKAVLAELKQRLLTELIPGCAAVLDALQEPYGIEEILQVGIFFETASRRILGETPDSGRSSTGAGSISGIWARSERESRMRKSVSCYWKRCSPERTRNDYCALSQ